MLTTVTSHTNDFPPCHGINVSPSGCLPSCLTSPEGSFVAGIPAETKDLQMMSFIAEGLGCNLFSTQCVYNANDCTAGYGKHRLCLKRANANVNYIGCYPQMLALSAYANLHADHLSTSKPYDMTNLTDIVHYGYARHLYVYTNTLLSLCRNINAGPLSLRPKYVQFLPRCSYAGEVFL